MKIINVVYALAAIVVLLGAYLKLNDYAFSAIFTLGGLSIGIINSATHYILLLKKIQNLKENQETSSFN